MGFVGLQALSYVCVLMDMAMEMEMPSAYASSDLGSGDYMEVMYLT